MSKIAESAEHTRDATVNTVFIRVSDFASGCALTDNNSNSSGGSSSTAVRIGSPHPRMWFSTAWRVLVTSRKRPRSAVFDNSAIVEAKVDQWYAAAALNSSLSSSSSSSAGSVATAAVALSSSSSSSSSSAVAAPTGPEDEVVPDIARLQLMVENARASEVDVAAADDVWSSTETDRETAAAARKKSAKEYKKEADELLHNECEVLVKEIRSAMITAYHHYSDHIKRCVCVYMFFTFIYINSHRGDHTVMS